MNSRALARRLIFLFCSLLAVAGYSSSPKQIVAAPTNLESLVSKPRELTVSLHVTQDLLEAEWLDKKPIGWETPNYKFGAALAANSEVIIRKLFSKTQVVRNAGSPNGPVDLQITPKIISIKQNRPLWITQDCTLDLVCEWTIRDSGGNVIWLDTIAGRGTTKFKVDPVVRINLVMTDLFQKSLASIASSPEIDKFVAGRAK